MDVSVGHYSNSSVSLSAKRQIIMSRCAEQHFTSTHIFYFPPFIRIPFSE